MTRILILGWYDKEAYMRGRILYEGLRKRLARREDGSSVELFLPTGKEKYKKMRAKVRAKQYDAIIATGKFVFWNALFWAKSPIIYEAAVTEYDNLVLARGAVSKWSPYAWLLWLFDMLTLNAARLSIIDTGAHISWLRRKFLAFRKLRVVHVGAFSEYYKPAPGANKKGTAAYRRLHRKPSKRDPLLVGYFGTFIPLHGVDTILDAAKQLQELGKQKQGKQRRGVPARFELFGRGQDEARIRKRITDEKITNVVVRGFIPDWTKFRKELHRMDVLLGVFGDCSISRISVPHKIFESAALGKPVVTAATPAATETFSRSEMLFVPLDDPGALARAVTKLLDPKLRARYGSAAYAAIQERYYEERVADELLALVEKGKK